MLDLGSTGDSLGPFSGNGDGGDVAEGQRTSQQLASHKKLQQTQAKVDEVVDLMRTNVDNLLERDVKLSELDHTAEGLRDGASRFEQQAGKLKRKFWLQNLKLIIGLAVIVFIIIIVIVVSFMPESEKLAVPATTNQPNLTVATATEAQAQ